MTIEEEKAQLARLQGAADELRDKIERKEARVRILKDLEFLSDKDVELWVSSCGEELGEVPAHELRAALAAFWAEQALARSSAPETREVCTIVDVEYDNEQPPREGQKEDEDA